MFAHLPYSYQLTPSNTTTPPIKNEAVDSPTDSSDISPTDAQSTDSNQHQSTSIAQQYYPSSPYSSYGFPLFFSTDWSFPFQTPDPNSPIPPHIQSPLSAFPNSLYRPPFPDFYNNSASPMVQFSNSNGSKKSSIGRRPKEPPVDDMEEEDDDKKQKRRQRNKEAAARCRQRRLDLMSELQMTVTEIKSANNMKGAEIAKIRKELMTYRKYLEEHECKLTQEERRQHLNMMTVPQAMIYPTNPSIQMPSRAASSNMSSSGSETHSPNEDYKPSLDDLQQMMRPPQSTVPVGRLQPSQIMPPPPQPTTSSSSSSVTLPIPNMPNFTSIPNRNSDIFQHPEPKIPKLDSDRTLASLSMDPIERPQLLPMLSDSSTTSSIISTPSRVFRPFYPGGQAFALEGSQRGTDFLASNTGLTPSGIPTMQFVSTPTPLNAHSEPDLRPL